MILDRLTSGDQHLSEEKLQALALAGALWQDVQVHAAAVDELCGHASIAQGLLQAADHILGVISLHVDIVAQLVRPLLALCLHTWNAWLPIRKQFDSMHMALVDQDGPH